MKIAVRLFARARDLAGRETLPVELSAGATVAEVRSALGAVCPALGSLLQRSALAVDGEFAREDVRVTESAEIALLPPVSGGSDRVE